MQAVAGRQSLDANGIKHNSGAALPFHLTVTSNKGDIIIDSDFECRNLESYGRDSYMKLAAIRWLDRGSYTVRVKALANIPEIDGIPVHLVIDKTIKK